MACLTQASHVSIRPLRCISWRNILCSIQCRQVYYVAVEMCYYAAGQVIMKTDELRRATVLQLQTQLRICHVRSQCQTGSLSVYIMKRGHLLLTVCALRTVYLQNNVFKRVHWCQMMFKNFLFVEKVSVVKTFFEILRPRRGLWLHVSRPRPWH